MDNKFPEHEKMQLVAGKSYVIGEFLDWLVNEKKVVFAQYKEHRHDDILEEYEYKTIPEWLAEYYKIDLKKIEKEKQKMLSQLKNIG